MPLSENVNSHAFVGPPDDGGAAAVVSRADLARGAATVAGATNAAPDDAALLGLAEARAVARISSDYLLRTIHLLKEAHGGNLLDALIFQAIAQANVAHLHGPETLRWSHPPSDDQRRPVSILAIATGLGLPFETTRRHVNRMIDDGRCRRDTGGVIAPAAALASNRATTAAEKNLANLKRCLRELARAGVALG